MKRIGYARVSTREQSLNSQALEQQIARLIPHTDEVWSDVESGKNDTRKNFSKLEKLINSGEQVTIIVTRLDRLSRRLITLKKFIDLVTEKNCSIQALDNQIDTSTAAGKFHISLLGALAEMESDQISERVKYGLEHLRKNGKAYHAPFGFANQNYTFVHDKQPFLCCLDSKKEFSKYDIAVAIIHEFLKIKSITSLSCWLIETFGLAKRPETLSGWIKNPVLYGHISYKKSKTIFYNQHEPLVDKEILTKVSESLNFNSKVKGHSCYCAYNLSGLIYCPCGEKATILSRKGHKYVYCRLFARCSEHKQRKICRYYELEAKVFQAISNKAADLSFFIEKSPTENTRIKQLQSELSQLEVIPSPHKAILSAIAEIKSEIEAERLKDSYSDKSGDRQLFIDTFTAPDFWEFFATEPLEVRQSLMRKFVKKIVFNPFSIEFNI